MLSWITGCAIWTVTNRALEIIDANDRDQDLVSLADIECCWLM